MTCLQADETTCFLLKRRLHPPLPHPVFRSHSQRSDFPNPLYWGVPSHGLEAGGSRSGEVGRAIHMLYLRGARLSSGYFCICYHIQSSWFPVRKSRTVIKNTGSRVRLPGLQSQTRDSLAGLQRASHLTPLCPNGFIRERETIRELELLWGSNEAIHTGPWNNTWPIVPWTW